MPPIIHPIADEITADLGLTPEQVWDQIRVTLQIYVEKSLRAE